MQMKRNILPIKCKVNERSAKCNDYHTTPNLLNYFISLFANPMKVIAIFEIAYLKCALNYTLLIVYLIERNKVLIKL